MSRAVWPLSYDSVAQSGCSGRLLTCVLCGFKSHPNHVANNKVWRVGDKVKSNDNKYEGVVQEIVDSNHVNVQVGGYGKMQFRNRELKRKFG
jgi:hypothetical protein